jgi:hypothetical protein
MQYFFRLYNLPSYIKNQWPLCSILVTQNMLLLVFVCDPGTLYVNIALGETLKHSGNLRLGLQEVKKNMTPLKITIQGKEYGIEDSKIEPIVSCFRFTFSFARF